jgi:hypothetical protein
MLISVSSSSAPYTVADNRPRLKIHGMLSFVREVRPPIFHLHGRGVGILKMGPAVLRPMFLHLSVDSGQIGASVFRRLRACAGFLRNS